MAMRSIAMARRWRPAVVMEFGLRSFLRVQRGRLPLLRYAASAAQDDRSQDIDWSSWRAGGWQLTAENFRRSPLGAYWKDVPKHPLAADDFMGRQAIFSKLMALEPISKIFGPSQIHGLPTRHFFWGYSAQLDWQWRTGRLGDANGRISSDSWFGAMNYSLCVVPLAAALDAGLVSTKEVESVDFEEAERKEFAAARAEWVRFWRSLQSRAKEPEPLTTEEHDKLRAHVWTCHMSSLHAARPLYQALLEPLPLDERRFCEGWTCFVDLLAAIRFRTDLDFLFTTGAGYLPLQLPEDISRRHALDVQDWELQRMRQSTKVAQQVGRMSSYSLSLLVSLWRRATRRLHRRERAHEIVQELGRPEVKPQLMAILRLLGWFVWP